MAPAPFWQLATEPVQSLQYRYVILGTAIWTVAYFIMHAVTHKLAQTFNSKYRAYDTKDRAEYRQYVVSPIHSLSAVMFSLGAMFLVCGGTSNVFNDFECFDQVRYWHLWALTNTCGFFIVDFGYSAFVVKRHNELDK